MPSKLVTCPETDDLVRVDYDRHPLGSLTCACSRFDPPEAITCARSCARRFDLRARLGRGTQETTHAGRSPLLVGDDTEQIEIEIGPCTWQLGAC